MLKTNSLLSKWLYLIRTAWVIIFLSTIGLIVSYFPSIYNRSALICESVADCYLPNKFTADELALLPDQGNGLINFMLAFEAVSLLAWLGAALAIFWLKSDELIGLAGSLFLATFYASIFSGYIIANRGELAYLVQVLLIAVGQSSIIFVLYVFPNGKFIPRWSRWVAIFIGLLAVYMMLVAYFATNRDQAFGRWFGLVYFGLFLLGVILQIYRYLKVSTVIQRQQTKWVVIAIAMVPASDLLFRSFILPQLFPAAMIPGQTHLIWNAITIPLFRTVPFLMIPISFVFSILKYRLWDIDILIRRTLVYSVLTGLLGFIYFTGVALMQGVITASSRMQTTEGLPVPASPVVIVLSTLAIAALANPMRHRIQDFIDRRFYRQKYDAEKALAGFAETTRSESELGKVTTCLVDTIQSTLQPEKTLVWISKPTPVEANSQGGPALWMQKGSLMAAKLR